MSELVAKPITVCGIGGFREGLNPPYETTLVRFPCSLAARTIIGQAIHADGGACLGA